MPDNFFILGVIELRLKCVLVLKSCYGGFIPSYITWDSDFTERKQ